MSRGISLLRKFLPPLRPRSPLSFSSLASSLDSASAVSEPPGNELASVDFRQTLLELQRRNRRVDDGDLGQFRRQLLSEFSQATRDYGSLVPWSHVKPLIIKTAKFGDWATCLDLYDLTVTSQESNSRPDGTSSKTDEDGSVATYVLATLAESSDLNASRWMHRLYAKLPSERRTAFQLDLLVGKCIEQCDYESINAVGLEHVLAVNSESLVEDLVCEIFLPHAKFAECAALMRRDGVQVTEAAMSAFLEYALGHDAERGEDWQFLLAQLRALYPSTLPPGNRTAFADALERFLQSHLPPEAILAELEKI